MIYPKIGMRVKIVAYEHSLGYQEHIGLSGVIMRQNPGYNNWETLSLVHFGEDKWGWYYPGELEIDDRRKGGERRTEYCVYHSLTFDTQMMLEQRKSFERRGKKTLAQLKLFLLSFDIQSRPISLDERAEAIFKFMNEGKL
jgi:hypothetical protein